MTDIVEFRAEHAEAIARLCDELGWPSWTDPATVAQGFTNPGVAAVAAVDGGELVGFAQAFGDGIVQAHLSLLGVVAARRREGIGRRLVVAVFAASGAGRMDLLSDADEFYANFRHRRMSGFRIWPA